MFYKIAKYVIRCVLLFILFLGGLFAYTVQTWEEPCSARPTPMIPYPCGEEK